jgi:transposase
MREHGVQLVYAPHRVWCAVCGLRVERVPWADGRQRVTHALARAVAALARERDWTGVAAHFRLNGKPGAAAVEGAVLWGLAHRQWEPVHVLGLDEVSRRKGQQYLTVGYDLARGRVIWVGRDRTTATMERFFTWLGPRRAPARP